MDEPAHNSLTGKASLMFALAVLAGVALAWAISPALFRAMPTDTSRIAVLLDTLNDDASQPAIVLFGTSVGMASVDMARISGQLPGAPLAYNLSATGQTFTESYLYYQELPDSVDVVVQLVNPKNVFQERVMDPQKYNAFYMYGYRPDERTRSAMIEVFPVEMGDLFSRSDLQQRFDSRWASRQVADRFARSLLRRDLTLDRGTYDLFYPSSYSQRLPDQQYQIALEKEFGGVMKTRFWPLDNKLAMLQELANRTREQGAQLVLVIEPSHPFLIEGRGEIFTQTLDARFRQFAETNDVIVLNGREIVPEPMFVDAVHPTPEGAAIFSDWLAGELVRLRSDGEVNF